MPVVDAEGRVCKRAISKSSVPWYKDFKSTATYRSLLEEEVDAFWTFDSEPLPAHTDLRSYIERLGCCYVGFGGAATIGVFSAEAQMKLDVAFLPGTRGAATAAEQQAKLVEHLAENQQWRVVSSPSETEVVVECLFAPDVPAAAADAGDAAPADTAAYGVGHTVHITLADHTCAVLARSLQQQANSCPALRRTVKVLCQVLKQSNLLYPAAPGGITEVGLIVMALSALRSIEVPDGTSEVLAVLEHVASAFDHTAAMATLGGPAPRADAGHGTAPLNPADPASLRIATLFCLNPAAPAVRGPPCEANNFYRGSNLTPNCTRFIQIREVFKYCFTMLVKWQQPLVGGKQASKAASPYAYKGKSPLSSIISFKHLVQKETRAAAAAPGCPPPGAAKAGGGGGGAAAASLPATGGAAVSAKNAKKGKKALDVPAAAGTVVSLPQRQRLAAAAAAAAQATAAPPQAAAPQASVYPSVQQPQLQQQQQQQVSNACVFSFESKPPSVAVPREEQQGGSAFPISPVSALLPTTFHTQPTDLLLASMFPSCPQMVGASSASIWGSNGGVASSTW